MSDTIKFECKLTTTNPLAPLEFEVLLNDKSVFKNEHVAGPCQVMFEIEDNDNNHVLYFKMSGKTTDHTKIDDQGNIVSDAILQISNITIDQIMLDQLLPNSATYKHDFNGTKNTVSEKFYGQMGCNGTATFEFTTPFYLWLLENM